MLNKYYIIVGMTEYHIVPGDDFTFYQRENTVKYLWHLHSRIYELSLLLIGGELRYEKTYNCCRVCSFSTEENYVKILLFQPCLEEKQVGVLQSWTSMADQRSDVEQQRPLVRQAALYSYCLQVSSGLCFLSLHPACLGRTSLLTVGNE